MPLEPELLGPDRCLGEGDADLHGERLVSDPAVEELDKGAVAATAQPDATNAGFGRTVTSAQPRSLSARAACPREIIREAVKVGGKTAP